MTAAAQSLDSNWALDPKPAKVAGVGVLGAAGLGAVGLVASAALARRDRSSSRLRLLTKAPRKLAGPSTRGLHASAALLSGSVLADSLIEHSRANFENPGMYTPLLVSALSVVAGLDGAIGRRLPSAVRTGAYALGVATGVAGLGFHLFNVLRRPGGINWLNLFYAAPIGAPAALSLAGVIGASGEHLSGGLRRRRMFGLPAGRFLSALTGFGLIGTVGEAGLLHFRGSFQNPFMLLPVSLPPVAAALMGKSALDADTSHPRRLTRAWLWLTAALGIGGVGFHAFGVSRAMGGWRNWTQNVVDGPPLPAPPAFSALAIAALSALAFREAEA